jgi:hypothetical protein
MTQNGALRRKTAHGSLEYPLTIGRLIMQPVMLNVVVLHR